MWLCKLLKYYSKKKISSLTPMKAIIVFYTVLSKSKGDKNSCFLKKEKKKKIILCALYHGILRFLSH